jgi:CRP-like cAMP-binding protein
MTVFAVQNLQFLTQIDAGKLQLMASCFRFMQLEQNGVLFKRDDLGKENGNGLHFMLEGEVKVQVLDEATNEEKVVAIVKKLQFFGEVGLVVHLPRTSTVTARKRCLFLELTQQDFRNFVTVRTAPPVIHQHQHQRQDR